MPRTWVQLHLGEQEFSGGQREDARKFVRLPHPRSGDDARWMLHGGRAYELVLARPPEGRGSWFLGDAVKQEGGIQITSAVDVVFLLVPLLMQHAQKRFVPLSDIWGSDPSGNYRKLVAHCDLSCVRFVCDIKEAGGDQYYRFSENRTLTWLSAKVERLLSAKHPLASAVELVAQYAPKQFEQQLDSVYGVGAAARQADKKRKMSIETVPTTAAVAPNVNSAVVPARAAVANAATGIGMFTARLCEPSGAPVQKKKLKVDKIDRRGMSKLTSFFKKKV